MNNGIITEIVITFKDREDKLYYPYNPMGAPLPRRGEAVFSNDGKHHLVVFVAHDYETKKVFIFCE